MNSLGLKFFLKNFHNFPNKTNGEHQSSRCDRQVNITDVDLAYGQSCVLWSYMYKPLLC